VVFKGGILGGARQFWGNPYLNSTTVLFDIYHTGYFDYTVGFQILLDPYWVECSWQQSITENFPYFSY